MNKPDWRRWLPFVFPSSPFAARIPCCHARLGGTGVAPPTELRSPAQVPAPAVPHTFMHAFIYVRVTDRLRFPYLDWSALAHRTWHINDLVACSWSWSGRVSFQCDKQHSGDFETAETDWSCGCIQELLWLWIQTKKKITRRCRLLCWCGIRGALFKRRRKETEVVTGLLETWWVT